MGKGTNRSALVLLTREEAAVGGEAEALLVMHGERPRADRPRQKRTGSSEFGFREETVTAWRIGVGFVRHRLHAFESQAS